MNYIQLINNFWALNREIGFNSHETQIYFYLLNESNKLNWKNPIFVSTNILTAELKISRKTLVNVREKLSKYGFINFQEGIKNKTRASYEILYVSQGNIKGNMNGNMNGNIDGNMNGNMKGNHLKETKLNKTKTIFIEPTLTEVISFFEDKFKDNPTININQIADSFYNFYDSKGWMVGKNKMTKWKSAARRWEVKEDIKKLTPTDQALQSHDRVMKMIDNEYEEYTRSGGYPNIQPI